MRPKRLTLPQLHNENRSGGFPDDFDRSAIAFDIRAYSERDIVNRRSLI